MSFPRKKTRKEDIRHMTIQHSVKRRRKNLNGKSLVKDILYLTTAETDVSRTVGPKQP